MGDDNNRQGLEARRRRAAAMACAVACFGAPAFAQRAPAAKVEPAARVEPAKAAAAPKAEPAVRAAAGVVVRYEESRSTNILYHEEKGGMLTAPPAIAGEAREPTAVPVAAPAAEPPSERKPAPTKR